MDFDKAFKEYMNELIELRYTDHDMKMLLTGFRKGYLTAMIGVSFSEDSNEVQNFFKTKFGPK